MKSPAYFRVLPLIACLAISACAHSYTLDPLDGKLEEVNGISLATLNTPDCVFQAGYQYSNPFEMLVHIRLTNKRKKPLEIEAGSFAMTGPAETVKGSPLGASEPEKYLKDLRASADLLDSRTHMESYQGVEELGELQGDKSDVSIDAAKDAYNHKVKEAKTSGEQAEAIRKRIAIIDPVALHKETLKPGESREGALIFKTAFGETGVVMIESSVAGCPGQLKFMLKR
jgi:hypothetical protein